ncbi:MAG: DEAD/DEAH box helicase [Patescibacteria group bacterium]
MDPSLLVKKVQPSQPQIPYQATHTFDEFPICDGLKQNIKARGYTTPTPIQDQAIGHLLAGRDVVGIANTGTGKTAAFLIPLIQKIYLDRSKKALIVAPTRELAIQILEETRVFTRGLGITSLLCIGGVGMYPQIAGLGRNPDIVVGTPGRLKDLNNQGKLHFSLYTSIVLDEVDRMLDMGFIQDIRFIIDKLPRVRQSLFFSATIPPKVESVMQAFLHDPVTISVKLQEAPVNVDQDVIKLNGRVKIEVLHDLLIAEGTKKVLVFGRTKWGLEKLAKELTLRGFTLAALHGNKNQNQRQRALDQFRQNRVSILLATDIASRGLDIADVTHVINYDLPETYNDYIHRIGRTGRANNKGIALTFVD